MKFITPGILINIHTHTQSHNHPGEFEIISCAPELSSTLIKQGKYVSSGIHPWETANSDNFHDDLELLEKLAINKSLMAVGESGMDRNRGASFTRQEKIFVTQAEIAEKAGLPMIIHCVRAFPEIIRIRKEFSSAPPWIIHGFAANRVIMNQLLSHCFYLSFGFAVMNPPEKLKEVIRNVPLSRIFFETDENNSGVKDIYNTFAALRNEELETLKSRIAANFLELFGNSRILQQGNL